MRRHLAFEKVNYESSDLKHARMGAPICVVKGEYHYRDGKSDIVDIRAFSSEYEALQYVIKANETLERMRYTYNTYMTEGKLSSGLHTELWHKYDRFLGYYGLSQIFYHKVPFKLNL
jgi:hypothetical protein